MALRSIQDINTHCLEQFRSHWECLEQNNQQLWQCRNKESKLNRCVFDNLVSLLYRVGFYDLLQSMD